MGNTFIVHVGSIYYGSIRAVSNLVYPTTPTPTAAPVPEAPGPDTLTLPICIFSNTEANHDLHEAISRAIHKTEQFYSVIRRDIGQCNNQIPHSFNFYDDEGIVKAIMGLTKSQVQNITANTPYALDILQHNPDNPLIESKIKRVRIQVCTHEVGHDYDDNHLLNLFILLGISDAAVDVFFIIDVGDHFVEKLRKITTNLSRPANRLKIHVVHSAVTQADSASKTKPNAKVYTDTDNNKCVRVFSWWYNQPIIVNGADARNFFLSQYDIRTEPANVAAVGAAAPADGAAGAGHSWKMRQTWTDSSVAPPNHVYETLDAHIYNSKPKVVTYLNTNLAAALPLNPANAIRKKHCSLDMQKKRSGDWLQIWMAHKLPEFLSNRDNFKGMNKIQYSTTNPARPAVSATDIPVLTFPEYKRRTYFITGDWPAACYAIYRNVNVMLVINGSTKNNIKPAIICINCD